MTTQTPYEPPPHGAYPTSPPWATPPPAPPPQHPPGQPWGGAPYAQHGRLMVPYPEEMFNATRPKPPSWWPVAVLTFLFGPFGAISAARRAGQARQGRNDRHPYWIAFAATMAAILVLQGVLAVTVGIPALQEIQESAATKVVQEKAAAGTGVASATCKPVGDRRSDGLRDYTCAVRLDNGRNGTLKVTADAKGNWQTTA